MALPTMVDRDRWVQPDSTAPVLSALPLCHLKQRCGKTAFLTLRADITGGPAA